MRTPCYCGYHHDYESDYSEYETEYDSDYETDQFDGCTGFIQVDLSSYMDLGINDTYLYADPKTDTYYGLPNNYDYIDWRMNISMVHNELVM